MSDRDPLEQLAGFRTGPVTPLPAAEVRRLGDRRRTRRTALTAVAACVAVLAVVVPAGLYATRGDDPDRKPPVATTSVSPTPSPTAGGKRDQRSPESIGLGDIPADFPLDLDWFDAGSEGGKEGPAPTVPVGAPEACGTAGLSAARAVGRLAVVVTAPEYAEERELRTYPDAATAAAVLAQVREEVAACTTYQAAGTVVMGVMPLTADTGYDTVAFAQTQEPYATGFFLTRVGRAIVQLRTGGEWMVDSITSTGVAEYTTLSRKLAGHMCVFTTAGCSAPPTTDRSAGTTSGGDTASSAPTALVTLAPVTADGDVVEGYSVAAETLAEGLDCLSSPAAPAHDVYTCGAVASGLTACWKETAATALCLPGVQATQLVRVGVSTFHTADMGPTYHALELANGDRYLLRHGGASGTQLEHPTWVVCFESPTADPVWADPATAGVDTSGAAWTVQVGGTRGALRTAVVSRAWVLAVADAGAP